DTTKSASACDQNYFASAADQQENYSSKTNTSPARIAITSPTHPNSATNADAQSCKPSDWPNTSSSKQTALNAHNNACSSASIASSCHSTTTASVASRIGSDAQRLRPRYASRVE